VVASGSENTLTQTVDAEHLTSPGSTRGTVAYMSPEQARARELDARSDLFSLGSVLYEMATGALAFRGESTAVIYKAILDETPPSPLRLNPELLIGIEAILYKSIEKDRNLRYQSAADLRADLSRLKRDFDSGRSGSAMATASAAAGTASVASAAPYGTGGSTPAASTAAAPVAVNSRKYSVLGIAGAAILLVAAGGTYLLRGRAGGDKISSIAVLPFVNAPQGFFRLLSDLGSNVIAPANYAVAYAAAPERDKAFEYLERAYVQQETELVCSIEFPAYDSM